MKSQYNRGVHYLALALALVTLALTALGALISSHGYNLAIPDWPTSMGKLIPDDLSGGIYHVFLHRVLSALAGLMTLLLGVYLYTRDPRPETQKLGLAAVGLIFLQIVLGGIGVLTFFPSAVKIAHAALAQLFLACSVALVAHCSPLWSEQSDNPLDAKLPRRARALASMVMIQVLLGCVVRHVPKGGFYTVSLLLHIVVALGVLVSGVTVGLAILKARQGTVMSGAAGSTILLVLLQVLVGIGVLAAPAVDSAGQPTAGYISQSILHVTGGAALLGLSVYLCLITRRRAEFAAGK